MYENTIPTNATDLAQSVAENLRANGVSAEVTVIPKAKINDTKLLAIQIYEPGRSVHPTIDIDNILGRIDEGETSLSAAAEEISNMYMHTVQSLPQKPSFEKEDVLPKLRIAAINTASNQELLRNLPHVNVHDLSLIAIYQVNDESHIKVTNDLCSLLEMTPGELMDAAIKSQAKQPYKIVSMQEQLGSMVDDEELMEEMFLDNSGPQMYVLSNESMSLGSGVFFVNNAMKQELIDRLQEPAVILPSSTHELLAIPVSQISSYEEIDEMIQSVNETSLSASDVLSNHCYMLNEDLSITMPTMAEDLAMKSSETLSTSFHI
ncbi:MAG: hypothetical protein IKU29_10045 [Parabacteroides sp.]|nr:hypothetical protein [Parabacteroides sp.]